MTLLITGGAGYIGSHVVFEALKDGREIVVLDDLSTGFRSRIPTSLPFEEVSLTDRESVFKVFEVHNITGVVHLAGKKQVGESMLRPEYYWNENVGGLQNLVAAMVEHGVKDFVFSSSASVYGEPDLGPDALISEGLECKPISPYGETKFEGERIAKEHAEKLDFKVAALRYFNVAGAGRPELGDQLPFNLVPIVFGALDRAEQPKVFGDDYPTPDGSCIRDYVHVQDLAEAHISALNYVENSQETFLPINVGAGHGVSVFEVIAEISRVSDIEISPVHAQRRKGDPAALVADVSRAAEILGWRSKKDLSDIVNSAWNAWSNNR